VAKPTIQSNYKLRITNYQLGEWSVLRCGRESVSGSLGYTNIPRSPTPYR